MGNKSAVLLCLMQLALAGCAQQSAIPAEPKATVVAPGEVGSRLPEFSIEDLQGHQISSADLRGKVVLVDLWATWCGPCKKEMPGYQKLEDRYASRGLAVVGFKFDTMADTEDPISFARKLASITRSPLH